jgi:hypothetical protein
VENRVSRAVAMSEYEKGKVMRNNGIACSCYRCKRDAV